MTVSVGVLGGQYADKEGGHGCLESAASAVCVMGHINGKS